VRWPCNTACSCSSGTQSAVLFDPMEELTAIQEGDQYHFLVRLLVATGIGFLVGLEREHVRQREREEGQFAGVRTFTLIGLCGFLSAFAAENIHPWAFMVAFAGFFALVITAYAHMARHGNVGGTSEISNILVFLLGGIAHAGYVLFALVVAVTMVLLLSFKVSLHKFIGRLRLNELRAIIQFVVISALVLPFLPRDEFGPYGVWNLKEIWVMVILVSGVSLVGYLLTKVMGDKGTLITGMVGGLVSSTAVTLSFAQKSRFMPDSSRSHAVSILMASTIMFPRLVLILLFLDPPLAEKLLIPMLLLTVVGTIASLVLHRRNTLSSERPPLSNPLNFQGALQFALLFAGVKLLMAYAGDRFGAAGVYVGSVLSGLTNMDAITLSMSRLANTPNALSLASNAIIIAGVANTVMKYLIVVFVGAPPLKKDVLLGFSAIAFTGVLWFGARLMF
jgi:uncharacterized membrane protein (DUF4010 family)